MRLNRFGLAADVLFVSLIGLEWMSLAVGRSVPGAWLVLWMAMASATWISSVRRLSSSTRIALLYVVTAFVIGFWGIEFGAGAAVFGSLAWALFVVRRVRYVQAITDDDVQFGRLWWDLGFMVFAAIVMPSSSAMLLLRHWIVLGFIVTVGLRIAGMRTAQIERARTKGVAHVTPLLGSFGVVTALLGIGFFCFLSFPGFRFTLIIACIGSAFIYWLFSSRQNLIGALILSFILLVILWFVNYAEEHAKHHPKGQSMPPANLGFSHIKQHMRTGASIHIPSFVWILIAMAVLGVGFLILQSMKKKPPIVDPVVDAPVIERSRIARTETSRFSGGSGIVGLTLRWLNWQHRQGRTIRRGETVRSYWLRTSNQDVSSETRRPAEMVNAGADGISSSAAQTVQQVIDLYEAARYGGQPVPDEAVSALEQKLQNLGLFGRRRKR